MSSASLLQNNPDHPSYDDLALTVAKQQQEIELYKFQLDQLKQYVYGRRSEKQYPVSPLQGNLFEQPVEKPSEPEVSIEVPSHKRHRGSKKAIPKDLPIDEVVYEFGETHCPCCAKELKEFSRDIREEVEFEPARFFKRHHVTVHKGCPKCKSVYSGETPLKNQPVIPGSQIGAGFLGHMVTSKICDHMPYYRQSKIYKREGVIIPDKTLSRYGLTVGSLLEPIAKAIKKELLAKSYLQADETRLEVLDPKVKGKTHRGQLWLLNDPLGALAYYEYHDSRSQFAASSLIGTYRGALQTDAYTCYDKHPGLQLGCMAHARRYFVEASKLGNARLNCAHVLKLIGKLYGIERDLRKLKKTMMLDEWYQARLAVRQEQSGELLDDLQQYLVKIKDHWLLERHPMYKALNYMLNRYESFGEYTKDGRFEIDNNLAENMMRPIALGRRNWLFAGSEYGARMSAVMMSVVQTCLRLGINPQRYLADVLPQLANHDTTSMDGLTPWDWASVVEHKASV